MKSQGRKEYRTDNNCLLHWQVDVIKSGAVMRESHTLASVKP